MTERKIRVLVAKPGLDGHERGAKVIDRKSTRLNSSHDQISYAVFCLKKKKKNNHRRLSDHTKNILCQNIKVVLARRAAHLITPPRAHAHKALHPHLHTTTDCLSAHLA